MYYVYYCDVRTVDPVIFKNFYSLCREISFQFRTRLPHGLLVYHNVKNPDRINLNPYALYVIVEKGQLKVVHVFGKHSTSVTVGEGLNRDEWHSVMVRE
uniref:Laminin G domain-containing protein n=1 Tax=Glossina palpalis gambiensis TaxID=67801 RepID=A0A1B0AZ10_9MUSC